MDVVLDGYRAEVQERGASARLRGVRVCVCNREIRISRMNLWLCDAR